MAFWDKLKRKKQDGQEDISGQETVMEERQKEMGPEVPPSVPPEDDGSAAEPEQSRLIDISSREYILAELGGGIDHPGEIRAVEPFIQAIQANIKEYMELEEQYTQLLELSGAVSSEKPEDAGEQSMEDGEEVPEQVMPQPRDAQARVFISADGMTAFLYCIAPVGAAADMDADMLLKAIADAGVRDGIDQSGVVWIAEHKKYFRVYPVARGKEPVKGEDGKVIDLFTRERLFNLEEDERGNIDFKNIYTFKNVVKGDVICELIFPTEGEEGNDVKGNPIPAKKGTMPPIPQGTNTIVDKEKKALVSAADGVITFQKDGFQVEPQLVIQGNVDGTTGNVEFAGDILITGDVQRGFQVRAEASIIVCGMVEGAVLVAGKDIEIKKGMNGSGDGTLTAEGDIRSRYLEQTKATAGGEVSAETIINCNVTCGGNILALSGKGIIIGGILAAGQSVEARRIGNQSNIRTVIKIGTSMDEAEDIESVTSELKNASDTFEKINKNVNYLKCLPSIPESKMELYKTLLEQQETYGSLVEDLNEKLEVLENRQMDYSQCHVRGNMIFSITEISLNFSKLVIQDITTRCNVYFSDGGLVKGTF